MNLFIFGCSDNSPPHIFEIGAQTAYVGSRLEFKVIAADPEGDPISFSFSSPTLKIKDRARLLPLVNEAIFSWTPFASDVGEHKLDFTASDGDLVDLESVPLTVKPGTDAQTAPIFRKPLGEGTTLDLAVKQCLTVDVLVEDPDSQAVEIRQDPPVPGSKFQSTGSYSARFSWCPTPAQTAKNVYVLHLVAKDNDNPPVSKDFTILLRSELPQNCPGEPPLITHTPPSPGESDQDIEITAEVTDDAGLKDPPTVYFDLVKPLDPLNLDYGKMSQITLEQDSGSTYKGTLPNPTAQLQPGEMASLYYVIVAEDDDDRDGPCDHRTRSPESDVYQVDVTKPQQGGTCTSSAQCKPGEVCDGTACVPDTCTPVDSNSDKFYWEQSSCPTDHFCPSKGPGLGPSHCTQTCTSDTDCTVSGTKCKVFDTKKGCGVEGTKTVGEGCADFTECEGIAMCLSWAKGYCTISDCDSYGGFSGPCPTGSTCVPLPDDRFTVLKKHWICLKDCTTDGDCRAADGYECKSVTDDKDATTTVCLQKGP